MLWRWGGDFYQVPTPAWLGGPVEVPLVTAMRSSGERSICRIRWCVSSSCSARS